MDRGRRDTLIFGSVAAVAGAAGALVAALTVQSTSGAGELLSTPFLDLNGRSRSLEEWRGRALVCNFWATWCEPCREELPLLARTRGKHVANGLEIVAIAVDNAGNVRKYLQNLEAQLVFLVGGAATVDLMRRLGNQAGALPFSVLLDRQGRLRERKLGAFTAETLEHEVRALLR